MNLRKSVHSIQIFIYANYNENVSYILQTYRDTCSNKAGDSLDVEAVL